jgi:long-chain-fatty-acid--CoA ligase ACSBG
MGYMHDLEKTEASLTSDGFYRTGFYRIMLTNFPHLHFKGDIATFDDDNDTRVQGIGGFMKIIGRIKDLIITAGGYNIAPLLIENEMKANIPALSTCYVIGDKKKYLTMLICLKCDVDIETNAPTSQLSNAVLHICKSMGSASKTLEEAAADPLWIEYIENGIKIANSKAVSNAQKIQKWRMLPVDFSERSGELTATQKVKRHVVDEKYKTLINQMYD